MGALEHVATGHKRKATTQAMGRLTICNVSRNLCNEKKNPFLGFMTVQLLEQEHLIACPKKKRILVIRLDQAEVEHNK